MDQEIIHSHSARNMSRVRLRLLFVYPRTYQKPSYLLPVSLEVPPAAGT